MPSLSATSAHCDQRKSAWRNARIENGQRRSADKTWPRQCRLHRRAGARDWPLESRPRGGGAPSSEDVSRETWRPAAVCESARSDPHQGSPKRLPRSPIWTDTFQKVSLSESPPSGGRPARARSRRMPPQAWLGLGEASVHASIVFLLPKLVCDALDRASPDPERLGHLAIQPSAVRRNRACSSEVAICSALFRLPQS